MNEGEERRSQSPLHRKPTLRDVLSEGLQRALPQRSRRSRCKRLPTRPSRKRKLEREEREEEGVVVYPGVDTMIMDEGGAGGAGGAGGEVVTPVLRPGGEKVRRIDTECIIKDEDPTVAVNQDDCDEW